MKIKVCGLRHADEIMALASLPVDYLGFVFHELSPRSAYGVLDPEEIRFLPKQIKKVGVFVDADTETLIDTIRRYGLDLVQLHGHESPETCRLLKEEVRVIKAFPVDTGFSFATETEAYRDAVDYFLFDTKGLQAGGNGISFDWDLLSGYAEDLPFFLAGGIGPQHAPAVLNFRHPAFHALDLNSRFEFSPGRKNIAAIRGFLSAVKPTAHALRGY